jgi:hypothetical protein
LASDVYATQKKEATSGRLDAVFAKEASRTAQERRKEVVVAEGFSGRGGRVDEGKELVDIGAQVREDAWSRLAADAADERRAEDVVAQELASGGATDDGDEVGERDDLEDEISRQRGILRRRGRVSRRRFARGAMSVVRCVLLRGAIWAVCDQQVRRINSLRA